jgi:hypothetical protein
MEKSIKNKFDLFIQSLAFVFYEKDLSELDPETSQYLEDLGYLFKSKNDIPVLCPEINSIHEDLREKGLLFPHFEAWAKKSLDYFATDEQQKKMLEIQRLFENFNQ